MDQADFSVSLSLPLSFSESPCDSCSEFNGIEIMLVLQKHTYNNRERFRDLEFIFVSGSDK